MPSISELSSYTTPATPFERSRETHPYLMGDVFNNDKGEEFTLFEISNGSAYGVMTNEEGACYLKRFGKWLDLFEHGFKQNQENLKKEKEIEGWGLYAPRKLKDGSWAAITRLMYTTAICVNFDEITMYESRYCFSHNSILPSWYTAIFWLAQFKTKESLPVTNCAYRGILGTVPIFDEAATTQYYADLTELKWKDKVNGRDLHEHASYVMEKVVDEYREVAKVVQEKKLDQELREANELLNKAEEVKAKVIA